MARAPPTSTPASFFAFSWAFARAMADFWPLPAKTSPRQQAKGLNSVQDKLAQPRKAAPLPGWLPGKPPWQAHQCKGTLPACRRLHPLPGERRQQASKPPAALQHTHRRPWCLELKLASKGGPACSTRGAEVNDTRRRLQVQPCWAPEQCSRARWLPMHTWACLPERRAGRAGEEVRWQCPGFQLDG